MDNRAVTEEIKAKLPIEEVVAAYVPLKKAGRVFKGLCPFHNEKTPSFTVNPERGIYKCFGCGEGGDIFDFIMKIEGLTFPEALRMLAERAQVPLPEYHQQEKEKGPAKTRLFALNEFAATFWHRILQEHPKAATAREYLTGRGLSQKSMETFRIGYAPYGGATSTALTAAGFTRAEIQAAGEPGKFQDRLTFPIADITGKVVGFTGRLLEHAEDPKHVNRGPKYWNTPETPLFIKSRTLYALHLAKHAMQEQQLAILAEGQMDVVMLHQAGFTHTVASSGTALTSEQLTLIRRFVPAIVFAYDGDKAGREATMRGLELALETDLTPYVISIPNGKDPAECLQKDPGAWQEAYDHRLFYMEWIIRQLMPDGVGTLKPEQKKQVARNLVSWLAHIPDPSEQAEWFTKSAAYLQTEEKNLRELFQRLQTGKATPAAASSAPPVRTTSVAEIVSALLFTFPEILPALKDEIKVLKTWPLSTPFDQLLPLLNEDNLENALNQKLNDTQRTALHLASETALQQYEGLETSAAWALGEIAQLMRRQRTLAREQEKARLATAIQEAQVLGDKKRLQELFAELQKLA